MSLRLRLKKLTWGSFEFGCWCFQTGLLESRQGGVRFRMGVEKQRSTHNCRHYRLTHENQKICPRNEHSLENFNPVRGKRPFVNTFFWKIWRRHQYSFSHFIKDEINQVNGSFFKRNSFSLRLWPEWVISFWESHFKRQNVHWNRTIIRSLNENIGYRRRLSCGWTFSKNDGRSKNHTKRPIGLHGDCRTWSSLQRQFILCSDKSPWKKEKK